MELHLKRTICVSVFTTCFYIHTYTDNFLSNLYFVNFIQMDPGVSGECNKIRKICKYVNIDIDKKDDVYFCIVNLFSLLLLIAFIIGVLVCLSSSLQSSTLVIVPPFLANRSSFPLL